MVHSGQSPKVSVIVRCLNEEKHIGKLLIGIGQQSLRDVEVIIVDSGSTDDTLEIARKFPCKIVQIRPEEFSFGRAINIGAKAASGEFLIFASAHVYPVYDDWLERLVDPFKDPKVAVCYGRQSGNELTRFSEHQLFAATFPDGRSGIQKHPFSNNANCAIRRSLWIETPYDEELTGLEDLDWASKMMRKGLAVYYSAEAEIVHVHEEKPRQIFNRYRREAIALRIIDPSQKMSFGGFLQLFISNAISDWIHAIREGRFFRVAYDVLLFRFLQFWGAYVGAKQVGTVSEDLKRTFYYPRGFSIGSKHTAERRVVKERQRIQYGQIGGSSH
jgi:rhamnosyltransferase